MKRFMSTVVVAAASAFLLVSAPVFANGSSSGATAAPVNSQSKATAAGPTAGDTVTAAGALVHLTFDANCGLLTEVAADHVTIKKAGGALVKVMVGARTWYLTRGLETAQTGPKTGEYATTAGGDETGDGTALVLLYSKNNFCHHARRTLSFTGTVTNIDAAQTTLQINSAPGTATGVTHTFTLNAQTKYYVSAKLVTTAPKLAVGWRVRVAAAVPASGPSANAQLVALKVWVLKTTTT